MAKRHAYNYFEGFIHMADNAHACARMLQEVFANFDPEALQGQMERMHALEHQGDMAQHEMMAKLVKEFITPIDRDDIMRLAREIDNVTDSIEDVLLHMYMFHIDQLRPEALAFAQVIERCCASLKTALSEFEHFRKSSKLRDLLIQINGLEEEGDQLYTRAVRALYGQGDPVQILAWNEVFKKLEACCDACEHAADAIEGVVMDNT